MRLLTRDHKSLPVKPREDETRLKISLNNYNVDVMRCLGWKWGQSIESWMERGLL